ncbi:hypothetical protein [Sphingomicrobium astaxanthinifaciens]|uniref:hypothetical protein n=1 Tax=Sphingomicrobium astaxanthinifaciens TaxID=1227949 RepID=UPI001FCA6FF0|nr:hypothetical protein [Sphingomicrobium astaxanthinifaciens]MCJ7422167.1 hypothetical protein [Sphingomicrobium astaxanthinifaciens]
MSGHPLRGKMGGGRPPEPPEDGDEARAEDRPERTPETTAPERETIDVALDPAAGTDPAPGEDAMPDPLAPTLRVFKKPTVTLPPDPDTPALDLTASEEIEHGADPVDLLPDDLGSEQAPDYAAPGDEPAIAAHPEPLAPEVSFDAPAPSEPEPEPGSHAQSEPGADAMTATHAPDWGAPLPGDARDAPEASASTDGADEPMAEAASPEPGYAEAYAEPKPAPEPAYAEPYAEPEPIDWDIDPAAYVETVEDVPATPAGRKLLAALLLLAGIGWLGFVGWSAGRALASEAILAPEMALWVSAAMVPLILLALLWLMFGRTRRREAEAFTYQVALMRAEADALDRRLTSMSHNLGANRHRLGSLAGEVENRAEQAAARLSAIGADLEREVGRLAQHGSSLDRSASAARADMSALIAALPDAEEKVGRMTDRLQGATRSAVEDSQALEAAIARLAEGADAAESRLREAGSGLAEQFSALQQVGGDSVARLEAAREETAAMVDELLARSRATIEEIRSGIDAQGQAVDALVSRAQGGMEGLGTDAVGALYEQIEKTEGALGRIGEQVRERDEQARAMIAGLDTGLGALGERFAALGAEGDQRAEAISATLAQVRDHLAQTSNEAREQDGMLDTLATRSEGIRDTLTQLSNFLNQQLAGDIGGAQDAMDRLSGTGDGLAPRLAEIRSNAEEAGEAVDRTAARIDDNREALAALVEGLDTGTNEAQARLAELQQSISILQNDAQSLTAETGPALVEALVQVQEASARAREAAREAIAKAIPEAASNLSAEARKALEDAVEDVVLSQMKQLDALSARAVDAARGASDRLSAQMLSIGQTAAALEEHLSTVEEEGREAQSERFTHQVSLLMESLNSAAIDVEKILSDDVDDKSWAAYLKGERGVFTRKAVRLLSQGEAREIGDIYDSDPEFRGAVNRFIHDFESMLRRVLAERDGGMIGVTLMSSDMGKLYAALGQAIERKVGR